MALGTYNAPVNSGKASSMDPRPDKGHVGKPLIVVLREFKQGFVTPKYPNPKDVVVCDVVDLSPLYSGAEAVVLPSVIWGASAMVDRIKDNFVPGTAYPMKIVTVQGKNGPYASVQGLQVDPADAEMFQRAIAWDAQFGIAYIDHMAAQKRAADAAAAAQPAPVVQQPAAAAWQPQQAAQPAAAAWQPQQAAAPVAAPQSPSQAWTAAAQPAAPAAAWQPPTTAAELDAAIGDLGGS